MFLSILNLIKHYFFSDSHNTLNKSFPKQELHFYHHKVRCLLEHLQKYNPKILCQSNLNFLKKLLNIRKKGTKAPNFHLLQA